MRRRRGFAFFVAALGSASLLASLSAQPGVSDAQAADTCPNAAVRAQQGSQHLPHCRAYELVSPADKAGGQVAFPIGNGNRLAAQSMINAASPDGETVAYWAYAAFADPKTGLPASYRARRTPSGWQSEMWSPAAGFDHPWLQGARSLFVAASEDLSVALLETPDRFHPDDQDSTDTGFGGGLDIYRLSDDGPTWLSRPNTPGPDTYNASAWLQGHSADGSVIAFETRDPLVPAAAISEEEDSEGQLYVNVGGQVELISVDEAGNPLSACGAVAGAQERHTTKQGAASRDGNRVFFTTPSSNGSGACGAPPQVYMWEQGRTVHVSASQRSGAPEPVQPAEFMGATPDGSKVFFASGAALTDDASAGTSHIYGYDAESENLELVAEPGGAVLGFSDDGERVYVMSPSAANPGVAEGFLFENGEKIRFASLVGGTTELHPQGYFPGTNETPVRVTPDGRYILYPSTADETTFESHGAFQFYRYDAVTGETVCVSCNVTGKPPVGDAEEGGDASRSYVSAYPKIRLMSADGQRVFFSSSDRIVAADQTSPTGENEASGSDVYEWRDGKVSLLSDGVSEKPSVLFAVGGEGRDVFFGTTSALVPQDTDGGDYDIYNAREGGGFLAPEGPPPCSGEGCQGQMATPPPPPPVGSATLRGPGNPKAGCRRGKGRKHADKKRSKARKGNRALASRRKCAGAVKGGRK